MKKIALILALVMVFAVALVACDTAENTSEPADESSVAGGLAESTPAESVPADEEEEEKVFSEGKTYTYTDTGLYYITWDEQWTVSKNAAALLTDGVTVGENIYYGDASFIGWSGEVPVVTIDLGAESTVTGIKYYAYGGMDGIAVPFGATVEVSVDGETWTEVYCLAAETDKVTSELSWAAEGYISEFTLTATEEAAARYVKLTYNKEGSFVFLTEIQVLGK